MMTSLCPSLNLPQSFMCILQQLRFSLKKKPHKTRPDVMMIIFNQHPAIKYWKISIELFIFHKDFKITVSKIRLKENLTNYVVLSQLSIPQGMFTICRGPTSIPNNIFHELAPPPSLHMILQFQATVLFVTLFQT